MDYESIFYEHEEQFAIKNAFKIGYRKVCKKDRN